MAVIELIARPVFYAPTKGRSYLTARAAARNEADAMLCKKYPREHAEYENGMCYYPGWHWSADEQMLKVHARLSRLILQQFRKAQRAQAQKGQA